MKAITLLTFVILTIPAARADFVKTTLNEIASPVTTNARYALISGSALTTLFMVENFEHAENEFQQETKEDKPLGKFSKYGNWAGQMVPNAIYIATNYTIGYFSEEDKENYRRSAMMFKATLYSVSATTLLKYTVREKRPDSNHRDSFPSGHTTSAFAFASVVGAEHEWYWGAAAYTVAAFVAYSRINDNAHRLHDVVAGATIGISYGLGLHFLYVNEKSEIAKYSIAPYGNGLSIGYRTEF